MPPRRPRRRRSNVKDSSGDDKVTKSENSTPQDGNKSPATKISPAANKQFSKSNESNDGKNNNATKGRKRKRNSNRNSNSNSNKQEGHKPMPRGTSTPPKTQTTDPTLPSTISPLPSPQQTHVAHNRQFASGGTAAAADSTWEHLSPLLSSIVKVYCCHTDPHYSMPWQMKKQQTSTSSGFCIANRQILTNAHSIENHTQVKVRRRGNETKFIARVLCVGRECDLALLSVDDDEFWEGLVSVEFGPLPRLQETVTVIGYPVGGDNMSVSQGVVSRIDMQEYTHGGSGTQLLAVQIDAAINPGNSGGPVFAGGGECLGIAFQSLKDGETENIGYIIPTLVVEHFLTDYMRHGHYTAFPSAGFEWTRLENPSMRRFFGMHGSAVTGVLVKKIQPLAACRGVLEVGDVLLTIDGVRVANDGECVRPAYFIFSGLVFVSLSEMYLISEYGNDFAYKGPVKLLDKHLYGQKEAKGEEIVVLSHVLAHPVNIGFEWLLNRQVTSCNGTAIRNLAHFADLVLHGKGLDGEGDKRFAPDEADIEATSRNLTTVDLGGTDQGVGGKETSGGKGGYVCLKLDHDEVVVLDRDAAQTCEADILRQHNIAKSCSPGLLDKLDVEAPPVRYDVLVANDKDEDAGETDGGSTALTASTSGSSPRKKRRGSRGGKAKKASSVPEGNRDGVSGVSSDQRKDDTPTVPKPSSHKKDKGSESPGTGNPPSKTATRRADDSRSMQHADEHSSAPAPTSVRDAIAGVAKSSSPAGTGRRKRRRAREHKK